MNTLLWVAIWKDANDTDYSALVLDMDIVTQGETFQEALAEAEIAAEYLAFETYSAHIFDGDALEYRRAQNFTFDGIQSMGFAQIQIPDPETTIANIIDTWHQGDLLHEHLWEALGWTHEQYNRWVEGKAKPRSF